jgi:hypothetical protein
MSDEDDNKHLNDGAGGSPAPRGRSKSARRSGAQIDLRQALEAPVRVKRDSELKSMHPYEAMLRQHVRRSLVEKRVDSMEVVLAEAEKHKLIKELPPGPTGGIFIVPKNLPEAIERQIFDDPDYAEGKPSSFSRMLALLLTVIDVERLRRCFNGQRDGRSGR